MHLNKSRVVKGGLLFLIVYTVQEYAHYTYMNRALYLATSQDGRPYVYRVLVPIFARALIWLGLSAEDALTLLIIFSAIGLLYGIKYLLAAGRH
jgi:hypothetical protein